MMRGGGRGAGLGGGMLTYLVLGGVGSGLDC